MAVCGPTLGHRRAVAASQIVSPVLAVRFDANGFAVLDEFDLRERQALGFEFLTRSFR